MSRNWLWGAAALAVAGAVARQPLALAVAVALVMVAMLRQAWGPASLRALRYRRHIVPDRAFPGEWLALTAELENDKLLPVFWAEVLDPCPPEARWEHGQVEAQYWRPRPVLRQHLSLAWFQRVTRQYRVQLSARGCYLFGPARLLAGDPFGLSEAETESANVTEVVIYPRLLAPPRLAQLLRRPGTDRRIPWGLYLDPARCAGVREYRSGDPWRAIHWKATARSGSLQVKVCEPAANPGTALFLNLQTLPHSWGGTQLDILEAAISLAASLYRDEMEAGRPVGLFANGQMASWGRGPRQPLTADPAQWPVVLEGCGRLLPHGAAPFTDVVGSELARLPHGTALVVITAVAPPELVAGLAAAASRRFPVQVLWLGSAPPPALPAGISLQRVDWQEVA